LIFFDRLVRLPALHDLAKLLTLDPDMAF